MPELQEVVEHPDVPMAADMDGANTPKFTPNIVRLTPAELAAFFPLMSDTTGASNENRLVLVPIEELIIAFGTCADPLPGAISQVRVVELLQDVVEQEE